jgi:hypothetical protein
MKITVYLCKLELNRGMVEDFLSVLVSAKLIQYRYLHWKMDLPTVLKAGVSGIFNAFITALKNKRYFLFL